MRKYWKMLLKRRFLKMGVRTLISLSMLVISGIDMKKRKKPGYKPCQKAEMK